MGSGPACAYKASSRQSAQLSESLGEKGGGRAWNIAIKHSIYSSHITF